jgi:hypothetical protein
MLRVYKNVIFQVLFLNLLIQSKNVFVKDISDILNRDGACDPLDADGLHFLELFHIERNHSSDFS